jgi:UDP-N-acetylmuramyl tripeptide synthase
VAVVDNGRVMLHRKGRWHDLGGVDAMPLTMRGAARHNIENLLGATLLGAVTGVPVQSLRATLARFGSSPQDNPGRLQVYRFGGATVFVDFAHNPDGLGALCETARAVAAKRRLLLLGQAGNRDDTQLRELARAAWEATPFNRVVIKELPTMLRGRPAGAIPRVLSDELSKLGLARTQIDVAPTELDGLRKAFAWAKDGDVLVCPVHVDKAAAIAWFDRLTAAGWKAGTALPA